MTPPNSPLNPAAVWKIAERPRVSGNALDAMR